MKIILNILKQQILGAINLAIPLLAIGYFYPNLFYSFIGRLICAFCVGLYVFYLNYRITKNQTNVLSFIPSGKHKEEFEKIILGCKMEPKTINLRYSYSNEMIAMCMFNTVAIDPLIWNQVDPDPEMLKAKNVIETHIIPVLTENQKIRISRIREIFSDKVQNFIFKHELGHVFYNYTNKKLILMGIIAMIAAFIGVFTTILLKQFGIMSVIIGIIIGGFTDLLLNYSSNVFFKLHQEKIADIFAADYSSPEEIIATADFWEKHQYVCDSNSELGILRNVSPIILSGHYNGNDRAKFLRELAFRKQLVKN